MLGERLIIRKNHKVVAKELATIIEPEVKKIKKKYVITIAGETGTGKSGIAHVLTSIMTDRGIRTVLIQQDDYYKNPPKTNFKIRRKSVSKVGTSEVKMALLQKHIKKFRDAKTTKIAKPLVVFDEDLIREETIKCKGVNVMVVEGTYVSLLKEVDKKIILSQTYKDTYKARIERARDVVDRYDSKILEIEHKIIKDHKKYANIIIGKDYSVKTRDK